MNRTEEPLRRCEAVSPGNDAGEWEEARRASCSRFSEGGEDGENSAPSSPLDEWLDNRRAGFEPSIQRIPLAEMRRWTLDSSDGPLKLRHDSGRFFNVEGLRVTTNFGAKPQWDQAIIRQSERGLLGIAARIRDGVLEFLMQAKMEPGCVNILQASPTIQATRSNYTRVHQGKSPEYYELFGDCHPEGRWITRSPQIEQTTRFLGKKNTNAVLLLPRGQGIDERGNFRWCTLRELKELYLADNALNMNARSILACLPPMLHAGPPPGTRLLSGSSDAAALLERLYASLSALPSTPLSSSGIDDIIVWFHEMREYYRITAECRGIDELDGWRLSEDELSGDHFSVIGVRVKAQREVAEWDQPLIAQSEPELSVLVGRVINGEPCFLFQAKCDVGGDPPVHLAPTVSCAVPSKYRGTAEAPPFLNDVMNIPDGDFVFSAVLSEEGGRFHHCCNHYKILWDDDFPEHDIPMNFRWIPYRMIFELVRHGYLNIEARGLFGFLV